MIEVAMLGVAMQRAWTAVENRFALAHRKINNAAHYIKNFRWSDIIRTVYQHDFILIGYFNHSVKF